MSQTRQDIGIVMPLATQQGGAEALLLHLLRQKSERYRYVCTFLQPGPLAEEVRNLGYDVSVIPSTRLSSPINYIKTIWALRSWAKKKNLRTIVSWMPKAHLYVGIATLFARIRTVWYQHGVSSGNLLDRFTTALPANAVFCCSKTAKQAQDRLIPRRPTYVSYPGVDLTTDLPVSKQRARKLLGLHPTNPVVGMVARLERWKGAHIFVEAAPFILERYPEASLVIVGGPHSLDPGYAEALNRRVQELNLGKKLLLAGQKPMSETTLWQAASDIIVHPVVGIEPFGMSVVEAMAQGKLVIASNVGGPAEVIENGVSGILIDRDDSALLASTVNRLLLDDEHLTMIGEQARMRSQDFSTQVFASHFDDLLDRVL